MFVKIKKRVSTTASTNRHTKSFVTVQKGKKSYPKVNTIVEKMNTHHMKTLPKELSFTV